MLGAPGGRLRDRIAQAAAGTDGWSLDDRAGDVLHAALRQRWAWVQSPPGGDVAASVALVARLLDRLLQLDATVLFVAPSNHGVDRTVGALCERLAGTRRLRSGLVQRVGPLAPGAVRDRYGPYVEAGTIAADLRAGLDDRLAAMGLLDRRLRFEEAEHRITELDRDAEAVDDQLGQAVGGRPERRRYTDPDTLVLRRHALREQRRSARQDADRIARELARGGPVPPVEEVLGGSQVGEVGEVGSSPAERRRRLAEARDELAGARAGIEETLRGRCRLAATTIRSAYARDLPRADYDVVVMAGSVTIPEAYYLAGLSGRSVISVGDSAGDARQPADAVRRPPGRAAPTATGRAGRPTASGRPRSLRPRRAAGAGSAGAGQWAEFGVCGRLPSCRQSVSATSTPKWSAALRMLAKARSRSASLTSRTWSKRARAVRTCPASVSGSLRCSGNAYALSGSSLRSAASSCPCPASCGGFQVVLVTSASLPRRA